MRTMIEQLRAVIDYSPDSGVFRWRRTLKTAIAGAEAGYITWSGHRRISVLGKRLMAHRLAWLFVHGEMPNGMIDHIDGDGANNRIANLRLATPQLNSENRRKAAADNRSGQLGVTPVGRKFKATIGSNGKTRHVGTYATAEQAHEAYLQAKRKLHQGCTI